MSAYGYKRTFSHTVIYVRFAPESRHNLRLRQMSAFDPKRTIVRQCGSVVLTEIKVLFEETCYGENYTYHNS